MSLVEEYLGLQQKFESLVKENASLKHQLLISPCSLNKVLYPFGVFNDKIRRTAKKALAYSLPEYDFGVSGRLQDIAHACYQFADGAEPLGLFVERVAHDAEVALKLIKEAVEQAEKKV